MTNEEILEKIASAFTNPVNYKVHISLRRTTVSSKSTIVYHVHVDSHDTSFGAESASLRDALRKILNLSRYQNLDMWEHGRLKKIRDSFDGDASECNFDNIGEGSE